MEEIPNNHLGYIYIYIYINFVNNRIKLINYQPPRDLAGFLNHQQSGDHGKPMPLRPRQSSAVALVTAASYAGAGFYGQHLVEIVELLCPMRNIYIYMYYIISTYIYIYMHTIYIHYTYIYILHIYIYICIHTFEWCIFPLSSVAGLEYCSGLGSFFFLGREISGWKLSWT